jgi:predicted metal-dependent hydrolase
MHEVIHLLGEQVTYSVRVSHAARALRIAIGGDGTVTLTIPSRMSVEAGKQFLLQKASWIVKHVRRMKDNPQIILSHNSRQDFLRYKEQARALAEERLAYFNTQYGFTWKSVTIRNQKTRWGSCSKRGSLSFNYKIALLPRDACDYIIVHELCHLGEFNHSRAFWNLVAQTIPNHGALRKAMKHIH